MITKKGYTINELGVKAIRKMDEARDYFEFTAPETSGSVSKISFCVLHCYSVWLVLASVKDINASCHVIFNNLT